MLIILILLMRNINYYIILVLEIAFEYKSSNVLKHSVFSFKSIILDYLMNIFSKIVCKKFLDYILNFKIWNIVTKYRYYLKN